MTTKAKTATAKYEKEIITESLTVVDAEGKMRARLYTHHTSVVFSMYDTAGDFRMVQRVEANGEVSFIFSEPREGAKPGHNDTVQRLRLGMIPDGHGKREWEIALFDADESQRAQLLICPDGEARLYFLDNRDHSQMALDSEGATLWKGDKVVDRVGPASAEEEDPASPQPARAGDVRQLYCDLAENIAAVLDHPTTPDRVYNTLADAVSEVLNVTDAEPKTPEWVRQTLPLVGKHLAASQPQPPKPQAQFVKLALEILTQAPDRSTIPPSEAELAVSQRYVSALVDFISSPDVPAVVRGAAVGTLIRMAKKLGHEKLLAQLKELLRQKKEGRES